MWAAVPAGREIAFRQVLAEKNDIVSNSILRACLDERRLHSNFENSRSAIVDETWSLTKAVRIAGQNYPVTLCGEAGIAYGSARFTKLSNRNRDADGVVIHRQSRAHSIKHRFLIIEKAARSRMARKAIIAGDVFEFFDVIDPSRVRECLATCSGYERVVTLFRQTRKALHACVDAQRRMGFSKLSRLEWIADRGRNAVGNIVVRVRAFWRPERKHTLSRAVGKLRRYRFLCLKDAEARCQIRKRVANRLNAQSVGIGFHDREQWDLDRSCDCLDVIANNIEIDFQAQMGISIAVLASFYVRRAPPRKASRHALRK